MAITAEAMTSHISICSSHKREKQLMGVLRIIARYGRNFLGFRWFRHHVQVEKGMLDLFYTRVPDHHPFETKILLALEIIMGDLTALNAAVAANTQAVADTTTMVTALRTATDQAGIDAATKQIADNNAALAGLQPPPPVTPVSS